MDAGTVKIAIRSFLKEARQRLDEPAPIAKAAEACAEAGNPEKGVEVVLDVDQFLYEANAFLKAASLINRLSQS